MDHGYHIQTGTWDELQHDARSIRDAVFVQEQQIPEEEEWDEQDHVSRHFVVYDEGAAIATARLLDNNSIGRVAVLKPYRGKKIGWMLLDHIVKFAKQEKRPFAMLSSQVYVIGFYQSLGFHAQGEVYDDCGIPHIDMYQAFTY